MKLHEVCLDIRGDGDKYKVHGKIYTVVEGNLIGEDGRNIIETYSLCSLMVLPVEKVIDWSKVEVDTPIWVRESIKDDWIPMHFKSVLENDDQFETFCCGGTSHSMGGRVDERLLFKLDRSV